MMMTLYALFQGMNNFFYKKNIFILDNTKIKCYIHHVFGGNPENKKQKERKEKQ